MRVLEESVFLGWLNALGRRVASAVDRSVICSFLYWLFYRKIVCELLTESAIVGRVSSMGAPVARIVGGSAVISSLRGGLWPNGLKTSVFMNWLNKLIHFVPWLIERLMKKPFAENSFFIRILTVLAEKLHVLTALFMLAVFSVPHAYWNNIFGFLGALLLTLLFLFGCGRGVYQKTDIRDVGFAPIVCFLWMSVMFVASANPALSLRFYLFYLTGFLMIVLLVGSAASIEKLTSIVSALAVSLLVNSLMGCYRYFFNSQIRYGQTDFTTTGGIVVNRAEGFFENANVYSQFIVLVLPFVAALLLNAKNKKARVFYALLSALGVVSILTTLSRSGWLGLGLAAAVFCLLLNWRIIPAAILTALVSLPFWPAAVFPRILSMFNANDTSLLYRNKIFRVMYQVLEDYWLAGTGLGTDVVHEINARYDLTETAGIPAHIHNTYFQTWIETGLLGLILWLAMLFSAFRRGLICIYDQKCPKELRRLIAAGISGISGILLISFKEHVFFYPRLYMLFLFVIGFTLAAVKAGKEAVSGQEKAAP